MRTAAKTRLVLVSSNDRPLVSEIRELGSVNDADRIRRLRDAIAENRLKIDVHAIAEKIVDS